MAGIPLLLLIMRLSHLEHQIGKKLYQKLDNRLLPSMEGVVYRTIEKVRY
jgi:hypothetical protein